jgi:hypothetical protein
VRDVARLAAPRAAGRGKADQTGSPALGPQVGAAYTVAMETVRDQLDGHVPQETPAERARRVQWEAREIARARQEIAAGQGLDDDVLEAWLDALDGDPTTPLPTVTGRP